MSVGFRLQAWLRIECIFVLVAVIAGCSKAPDDERIRFGLPTAPTTLDPRFATDAVSYRLVRLLHRAPVAFDAAGRPVPDLTRWQQLDERRFRFSLVDEATFSDGHPVRAQDIAATYRAVLDPISASPHRVSLENVAGIEVRDDSSVDFVLRDPDPMFPGKLFIGVLPAAAVRSGQRDTWPSNSGAFELLARQTDGGVLLKRRRDGATLGFEIVKDTTVRALKLISGELDIIQGNLSPELFTWLGTRNELVADRFPGATFSYIGFNLQHGPTAQAAVRLAIAHALNVEAIVEHIFAGTARRASGIFPPTHWAGADLKPPVYDPQRARELLAKAGYAQGLQLEYKTSSDYFRQRLATAMQHQLAEVGIELEIRSHDWATFYADITQGKFQLYGLSWVGIKQPDIFRHAFHSDSRPPRGANRGGLGSEAIDSLIERAEGLRGTPAHAAALRAVQARLLDEMPYVPLWFEDQLVVARRAVGSYSTDADGNFDALINTCKGLSCASH